MRASTASPTSTMLASLWAEMPTVAAGMPLWRTMLCGTSSYPRVTRPMSPRRMVAPVPALR